MAMIGLRGGISFAAAALVVVVGCSTDTSGVHGGARAVDVRAVAVQRASGMLETPGAELDVLTSAVQRLPESGVTLHHTMFMSKANGRVARVTLDDEGRDVDAFTWAENERVARVANHGRMDAPLERAIARMLPGARRAVLVHVPIEEPWAGAADNLLRDPDAAQAEEVRAEKLLAAGVRRILAMLPSDVEWAWPGGASPFLALRLSSSEIQMLARSNDVGHVYDAAAPAPVRQSCDFDDHGTNVDEPPWNQYDVTHTTAMHQQGILGTGIKVASMFDLVCPYTTLPFDPTDPTHTRLPLSSSCTATHGAFTMGYMQNTNPDDPESPAPGTVKGMSPGAELFWSNVSVDVDPESGAAYHYLALNHIRIATASIAQSVCTGPGCTAPTQETWNAVSDYYATHAPFVLQLVPVGNGVTADPFGSYVRNQVHNGIVVGGATPCQLPALPCPYGRTAAQTIDNEVFTNPAPEYLEVGDHELPHVVSPGSFLRISLDDPDGCGGAGTSYATPIMAGAAALVADKNGQLYGRPEALKAVLLAGADVNTDLGTPTLAGGPWSYQPRYNMIAFGVGVDRHGGMGLFNTEASIKIGRAAQRMAKDDRAGLDFAYALGNTSANIQTYQAAITPTDAPEMIGHDYGVMDPSTDFDGIWWKHFYYFQPTKSGNLRIVLTWNRPYTCTFGSGTTTCGPGSKPDLDMLLRDLDAPTGAVSLSATYNPNEEFISVPVVAGKVYRLDIDKQNFWPGPESFGIAAWLTANQQ